METHIYAPPDGAEDGAAEDSPPDFRRPRGPADRRARPADPPPGRAEGARRLVRGERGERAPRPNLAWRPARERHEPPRAVRVRSAERLYRARAFRGRGGR